MRSQLEGSLAVARSIALCRPEVVSAYPISPQTHVVEASPTWSNGVNSRRAST